MSERQRCSSTKCLRPACPLKPMMILIQFFRTGSLEYEATTMANDYEPKPLQTDHVALDDELLKLVELLAENAHDIWASQRISDGWIFGPERCDESRHHPCLVPYSQLPEIEKAYDRNAVLGTIRAVLALGFVITRREFDLATAQRIVGPERG